MTIICIYRPLRELTVLDKILTCRSINSVRFDKGERLLPGGARQHVQSLRRQSIEAVTLANSIWVRYPSLPGLITTQQPVNPATNILVIPATDPVHQRGRRLCFNQTPERHYGCVGPRVFRIVIFNRTPAATCVLPAI